MKLNRYLVASFVFCLLLTNCTPLSLTPITVPPTPTLDFSGAEATLTIVRTLKVMQGDATITAAIPLLFAVDEDDPWQPVIVWGYGEGTAVWNGLASGTGGSYNNTAQWPVEYEVRGNLIPSKAVCRLTLTVDEILLYSKPGIVHADPIGDQVVIGGEDEFTTFLDLKFTETQNTVTQDYGAMQNVFTIDDWCIPHSVICILGCIH
jgi:hypothetical protein